MRREGIIQQQRSGMGECVTDDEVQALRLETRRLQATVVELQERLSAAAVIKCGYLSKNRPCASFLQKPWEVRFFSLTNSTLSYWTSETQAANHTRAKYAVEKDWVVRLEGRGSVFVIEDRNGAVLLRLSAGSEAQSRSWLDAFKIAGCRVEEGFCCKQQQESSSSNSSAALTDGDEFREQVTGGLRHRQSAFSVNKKDHLREKGHLLQRDHPQKTTSQQDGLSYKLRPAVPAHRKSKESPLSSDAIFKQSHAGLFNLCIVLLVAVNGRLIIENLMKYGLLIQTEFLFSSKSWKDWPLLMCGLSLPVFPLFAYIIEKLKARRPCLSDKLVCAMHVVNLVVALVYPVYIVDKFGSDLLSGFVLMLVSITGWLKLVSYAHTNADIRSVLASGGQLETPADVPKVDYPDNISVSNIAYFMLAPTLCYQLSYPRSTGIRKGWLLRQLGKWLAFNAFMGFIIGQYMHPIIRNSQHPLRSHPLRAVERVLKLSIPTLYVWLGFFYCFFHLWLNMVAEVLRFGDREFYRDWWNATTVDDYWRLWNMPVHRWLLRHVYFPCLRLQLPKQVAMLLVFVLSGVFHELCIAVPCRMLRGWAFLGIMFQVPLVLASNLLHSRFRSPALGNMIFWFFFCIVGQPMSVLLYYHDVVSSSSSSGAVTAKPS